MNPPINQESPTTVATGPAVTSRPMTELERRMAEDLHWAATASEVQQHPGKVVAVRNKQVVAVCPDRETARRLAAAQAQCPPGEIVCVVVPGLTLEETPR